MKKLPTVTIGIPAYNEEENINFALRSVLSQKQDIWRLEDIIVVLDGSTDGTKRIVSSFQRNNRKIKVITGVKRLGKVERLNTIFKNSKSDLLFLLDADVVIGSTSTITKLVRAFNKRKNLQVAAAEQVAILQTSLVGKINTVGFTIWYRLLKSYRKGNNIHMLMGSATMLRREFYTKFRYPKNLATDQHYLYVKATLDNRSNFDFIGNTNILFRMPSTLADARKQGTRAIFDDKDVLVKVFSTSIKKEYSIPLILKVKTTIWAIKKYPILFPMNILLGVFIRLFPYEKKHNKQLWYAISSSKGAIIWMNS